MKKIPEWKLLEEAEEWKRQGREVVILDSHSQAYSPSLWHWKYFSHTPVTEGYGGASVVRLRILLIKRVKGEF